MPDRIPIVRSDRYEQQPITDDNTTTNGDHLLPEINTSAELFIPAELLLLRTTIENLLRQGGIDEKLVQDLSDEYRTRIMELAAHTAKLSRENVAYRVRDRERQTSTQELKKKNNDLQQLTESLSARVRMLEMFIAGVVHDVRNMLVSIFTVFDLERARLSPARVAVFDSNRGNILRSLEFMMEVIRTGVVGNLKASSVTVEETVNTILQTLQTKIENSSVPKKIKFWRDPAIDFGHDIVLTPDTFLFHILYNILSNALAIQEVKTIHIYTEMHGEQIEIHIVDDGPGIPPKNIQRIFTLFEREDTSPSDQTKHFGVGLAFAKYLVTMSGGSLEVTSEETFQGQQTEFVITLPSGPVGQEKAVASSHT